MTMLIVNNYYKKKNLSKVDQNASALRSLGKSKLERWGFSEINEKKIPDYVKAIILSGVAIFIYFKFLRERKR